MKESYFTVGRRKTSVARVKTMKTPEAGNILINKKPLKDYFTRPTHQVAVKQPLIVTDSEQTYTFHINVKGGGVTGQAEAIRHGIARALLIIDENNRGVLRKNGFLTRDSRKVERKKYGHKKARKSFQFSKR